MGNIGNDQTQESVDRLRTRDSVDTPWGDAGTLRERKLRPGGSHPRAQSRRNQRERLFAATVATVAEQGYEATTVADLGGLSGVSRRSFYAHLEDKQDCFLAAIDAMTGPALERLTGECEPIDEARGRQELEALLELIAAQPAAAKMCLVEIYAAGPEAAA